MVFGWKVFYWYCLSQAVVAIKSKCFAMWGHKIIGKIIPENRLIKFGLQYITFPYRCCPFSHGLCCVHSKQYRSHFNMNIIKSFCPCPSCEYIISTFHQRQRQLLRQPFHFIASFLTKLMFSPKYDSIYMQFTV